MNTITLVLLITSAIVLGAATINVASRVNLVALGLLAYVLTLLIPKL